MSTAPTEALSSDRRLRYATARKLAIVAETIESRVTASMVSSTSRSGSDDLPLAEQVRMSSTEPPLPVTARVFDTPTNGRPKPGMLLVLQDL
jgi:hypothetical protein